MIIFEILGYCQPKQRTFGKRFITPPATRKYEALVAQCAKLAMKGTKPKEGDIEVSLLIRYLIPKSFSKKNHADALVGNIKPLRGDLDNACKSILDGMNGIVYKDDRQISYIEARRIYSTNEGAIIEVRYGRDDY